MQGCMYLSVYVPLLEEVLDKLSMGMASAASLEDDSKAGFSDDSVHFDPVWLASQSSMSFVTKIPQASGFM